MVGLCVALASEFDLGLEWLRLDLDDTAFLTDFQRTTEKLSTLARLGVLAKIDHFGQAAIVLKRIVDLRINHLKVQGRVFERAAGGRRNDAMAAVINTIGKVMHVPLVAIQLESADMLAHAVDSGVEFLQGYSIGRCLGAEEAQQWRQEKSAPSG